MTENAKNGLVGIWKFNEGTGLVVNDSSGLDNHGEILPSDSQYETWGKDNFEGTLSLSGENENYVNIPASESLNKIITKVSVVANFFPRSFPTKEELEENIYANYVSVVQRQWALEIHPDLYYLGFGPANEVHGPEGVLNYKWHLGLVRADGELVMADLYVPDESGHILANRWMHMVGTFDGDSGLLRLYLDGRKIGEQIMMGEIRMDEASLDRPLVIGCELNTGGPVGNVDAYIDEVRVYDRVLSEDEIIKLAEQARK